MQTWTDIPCFDGVYTFKFGIGQINELEKKCDAGLGRIIARTIAGRYGLDAEDVLPEQADFRMAELFEIIRQGLIGGNHCLVDGEDKTVSSARADELVRNYLTNATDGRMSFKQTWALAARAIDAAFEGYRPPGEAGAGESPAA